MIIDRRAFLTSTALAGAAVVTGCTTAGVTTAWSTIVSQIQAAVASAAQYIPTIESIAATAASIFGPQYAAIVQLGTAAFNQVVATLVNIINSVPPPALMARLRASSPSSPVVIGRTSTGVTVTGWRA
jgi:hypothetical protein